MTTMHLTDAQRDTFTACGLIVIDGEPPAGEQPSVVDVAATALGYDKPTDGLIGSGLSKMLAYQRASEIVRALGLPITLSAETLRKWGAGAVIHLGQRQLVAPEGWRILTEPCEHNITDISGNCVDCVDGERRVVTLTAKCNYRESQYSGWCEGGRIWDSLDVLSDPCPKCDSGKVTLGRFTIPALLPVYGEQGIYTTRANYVEVTDQWLLLLFGSDGVQRTTTRLTLDPLPRPGQFIARPERVA